MTPFTILTGFLGAGKTTVVNRMLSAPGGRKIAVLVNELGRVAIDSKLILSRGGDVLELAGGCVCCKIDVKNDLWDGIADVVRRSRPDAVVLETTGIAEPPAITEGLARVDCVTGAGVVCVVDADAGARTLDAREEARAQLECADRVLLSKLDIAAPDAVDATHARIAEINSEAERASFPATDDGDRALTPWLLDRRALRRRAGAANRAHRHGQITAVSFVEDAPLSEAALRDLASSLSPRLLRVKGFVHLAGSERRGYLELAGNQLGLELGAPWADDTRRTELVLIGEDLDEAAIRRQLWACRTAPRPAG